MFYIKTTILSKVRILKVKKNRYFLWVDQNESIGYSIYQSDKNNTPPN